MPGRPASQFRHSASGGENCLNCLDQFSIESADVRVDVVGRVVLINGIPFFLFRVHIGVAEWGPPGFG